MTFRNNKNWRFIAILSAVSFLHVLLLLIPVVQQVAQKQSKSVPLQVRLSRPEPSDSTPPPDTQSLLRPVKPIELADLPVAVPAPVHPQVPAAEPDQSRVSRRILSEPFVQKPEETIFSPTAGADDDRPDYYARFRPGLEQVLNEPSLQLPFRDTRIYLVDSYDPGVAGGIQKFWDTVTVPFGWTTDNNTRIQCAWVLIIAGCSWGPTTLFHKKARKRRPDSGP